MTKLAAVEISHHRGNVMILHGEAKLNTLENPTNMPTSQEQAERSQRSVPG
jgi:hypothetical protein